jgi:hypothetical protein
LAIADLAGEDWGTKARDAAVTIERTSDSKTEGVRALAAIKAYFDRSNAVAVGSQFLIEEMAADTTSVWAEWRNGKPITQRQLANLLSPFRIYPDRVQVGTQQVRGYQRAWFEDAWGKIHPRVPPDLSVKSSDEQ